MIDLFEWAVLLTLLALATVSGKKEWSNQIIKALRESRRKKKLKKASTPPEIHL